MNNESQTRFAEASKMLAEALNLNASGKHGAAMNLAFEASEFTAAGYLSGVACQSLPPNDATYDLFAETIREPSRHPESALRIREIIGKVNALREAFEPSLLNETTPQDAQQMIDHVETLLELSREMAEK
jgi:hypothetical protein